MQLINFAYLIASVLFIVGLRGVTSPRTAARGNTLAALGMLVAVAATLLDRNIVRFEWIFGGIVLGSLIGVIAASKVPLTAMPELVAVFNGFGGGASALVATSAILAPETAPDVPAVQLYAAGGVSALIGGATLTGSLVAWLKLQEWLRVQPRGHVTRAGRPCVGGWFGRLCFVLGGEPGGRVGPLGGAGAGLCLWDWLDDARRRGGHAGRDRVAELVLWAGGGRNRLRT